jgi:N-acyl homoserine lactone hydrolase
MTTDSMLKLYIFDCGYLDATAVPFITSTGAVEKVTTRYFNGSYLVQHPQGLLLWDTGLSDELYKSPTGVTFGPWHMVVTKTLLSHLAALNIAPPDITYLAFSHMHADHTGNANLFAGSTILLHANEYDAAFRPNAPDGYNPSSYSALRDSQMIKLQEDYDIFGDGSVVILAAPGHSTGHQVLLLRLPTMGAVILSGDLYYSSLDRTQRRVPGWNVDREQTLHSMEQIEQIVQGHHATLIIHHDLDQIATLARAPAYLA